jgi:hypothetical protein
MMKKIKILFILPLITLLMIGCSDDDANIFIADLYADEITFENDFASEYLISDETSGNIADRFIWNEVTTVTTNQYELQASSTIGFDDHLLIGITNQNNHIVLVEDLLNLADELSLDNDPETTDGNGNPNNSGTVYFRVKASIGNGGAGSDEIFSDIASLNIKIIGLQESVSLWAVGGAVPGGWNFNDDTVELVETDPNVWSASINLNNDIFRFFQSFGTWNTDNNFTYYEDQGYTIDANFEVGPSEDANFNFIGNPGTYQLTINAVDKTITLN